MSKQFNLSLREAIFGKMSKSDGCYVMIYSGAGERLTFISSLFNRLRDHSELRLLLDFNMSKYASILNRKDSVLIDSFGRNPVDDSMESFFLRAIRENLRGFAERSSKPDRIIVIVECSSFLRATKDPVAERAIAFHKDFSGLINSVKGATGVLLYDIDVLTDRLAATLLRLHIRSEETKEEPILQALKREFHEGSRSVGAFPEIVVRDEGLVFTDPATNSAALLLPLSEAIKEVLPRDPLSVVDRDIAFANNYTAGEGACPYLADDVRSRCVLDPNVVKVQGTSGRPFIMGRSCVTAVDHMVIEAKSPEEENSNHYVEAEGAKDVSQD
jgi:hypothetical protein